MPCLWQSLGQAPKDQTEPERQSGAGPFAEPALHTALHKHVLSWLNAVACTHGPMLSSSLRARHVFALQYTAGGLCAVYQVQCFMLLHSLAHRDVKVVITCTLQLNVVFLTWSVSKSM